MSTTKSSDELHREIIEESLQDTASPKPWNPLVVLLIGVILALLVVFMVIPYYAISLDPRPDPVGREVLSDIAFTQINYTSNMQGIWNMIEQADMKLIAERIALAACPHGQDICYAKALYYFVRDEVQYIKDPVRYEYIKHPRTTLATYAGDCDDQAVLLASLLWNVGIPVEFVVIPGHMLIRADLPDAMRRYKGAGGYVYLDATCSNCKFGELSREVENAITV